MWEITVEFENEETVSFKGEEIEVPLWTALKFYNLFVKEAEGHAVYRQSTTAKPILLVDKIEQLTRNFCN